MSIKTFLVGCALYGVPGFILGLLMAGVLMGDSSAPEGVSYVDADANGDGKMDTRYEYTNGVLTGAAVDRNFDGSFDAWYSYADGVPVSAYTDDNFDGEIDVWESYQFGLPSVVKQDVDFDGVADMTYEHEHGLTKSGVCHPNDGPTVKRLVYEHGLLVREEIDITGDGSFSHRGVA